MSSDCLACNGSGYLFIGGYPRDCDVCGGTGEMDESEFHTGAEVTLTAVDGTEELKEPITSALINTEEVTAPDERRPVDLAEEAGGIAAEAAELAEHIRDTDPHHHREDLFDYLIEMIDDAHEAAVTAHVRLEDE